VNPLMGYLIAHRLATLRELKTVYSLQDAMEAWEAHYVPEYNKVMASRRAKEQCDFKLHH
jgi:hypothetical protein